jgi:hypothetical protein
MWIIEVKINNLQEQKFRSIIFIFLFFSMAILVF